MTAAMARPCDCCSRIYRAEPPNAEQPGEVRYAWVGPRGET